MVWFVVIPLLTGAFGKLRHAAADRRARRRLPWLNLVSYWIFPGGGLLFSSFLIGAPDAGWTEYPPISVSDRRDLDVVRRRLLVGISSTLTGSTSPSRSSRCARRDDLHRMPLFVWAQFATSPML